MSILTSEAKIIGNSLFGFVYSDSVDHTTETYMPPEEKRKIVKTSKKSLVRAKKNRNKIVIDENIFEEVKMLKSLDHPNIVNLYHFDEDDENYYTVYEACDGDLFELSNSNLDYFQKVQLLKEALQAIQYIHSLGITHFDISLENILYKKVGDRYTAKLCDFGLAKHTGMVTLEEMKNTFTNTPGKKEYIDPHIFFINTKISDLYSFGVCLWAFIFGFMPYDKKNTTYAYFIAHGPTALFNNYRTDIVLPDGNLPLVLDILETMIRVPKSLRELHGIRKPADQLLQHQLFTQI